MLEKIESGKEYLTSYGSKVKTIYVGDTVILYIVNNHEATISKEVTLKYWTEIPIEKPKCKLIVWKFNSCARLNKSVNFTGKEHLCNHYKKELSDLEFYHEMELENQL